MWGYDWGYLSYAALCLFSEIKDVDGQLDRRRHNRTRFIEHRRVMMQAWADYLELKLTRLPPPLGTG